MKKILLTIAIVFAVLLVAAAAIPYLFKDQIVAKVKSVINQKVNAKVDFKAFDLTLIRSFPKMGIRLNDLSVVGIDSFANDTLANIKQLQLDLNLMSVIKGETYEINAVSLQEPTILAKVLKSGKANWDIMKPDSTAKPADTASSSFKAALEKYDIEKGNITYDDASLNFYLKAENLNHSGKGNFTQDVFTLATVSDIEKLTVKYGGIPYLNGVVLDADLPLEMDMKQMKFTFGENKIKLNELVLSAVGYLAMPNDKDMVMDLKFDAQQSDLKNFLSLIPAIYAANFKDMQATGKFGVDGVVKGTYNENSIPTFNLNLAIKDGKIKYPSLPSAINNIQVKANVVNPDGVLDHTVVNIPAFHLEFGQAPLDGRLSVKNPMSDPFIDMALKGNLDLKQLTTIFPLEGMTISGNLQADVAAAGRKSSVDKGQYQDFKASGQMQASNFLYTGKNVPMPVSIPAAKMTFSPKNITLSNLTAKLGRSDFQANGSVNNYLNYVFKKNQLLEGNFNLTSNYIDVNELMGPKALEESKSKEEVPLAVVEVPANINFNMALKANKVKYDKYDISNARGALQVKDRTVYFKNLGLDMVGGTIKMNGSYATINPKRPKVAIDFGMEKVDIQQAFNAFNTVKLLTPIAQYAKGSFSTNLKFNSDLDDKMMPIYSSLNAEGLANIIQAVVDGFEPVNKLANTLGVAELKKVEVNDLKTKFSVEDGRLKVAPFNIKVKGITMNVQGSNGIDQTMDYDLVLNVPRAMLGSKANDLANSALANLNGKLGTNVSVGETIKINADLMGTFLKPSIKLKYGAGEGSASNAAKAAVTQVVEEKKAELEAKAKEKVDTLKKKAVEKATEEIGNKLKGLFNKKKKDTL
ncbi:AsmA-like C-terminal region-containing protein [Pedobacter sp.]